MPLFAPTAGYFKMHLTSEWRDKEKARTFIEFVKANVPYGDYGFDDDSKEWTIWDLYLPVIRQEWNRLFADPNQQDMFE